MISVKIIQLLQIQNQNKYLHIVRELKEIEKEYELVMKKYEDKLVQWRQINEECICIISKLDAGVAELRVKDFLSSFIYLKKVKGMANKYQEELDYLLSEGKEIGQKINELKDRLVETIYKQKGLECLAKRITHIKIEQFKKNYLKVLCDINNLNYFIRQASNE